MIWIRRLLPKHATYQNEISEEIAYHLEERTRSLITGGMTPIAARAQAEQEFGSVAQAMNEIGSIDRRYARALQARAWRTDVAGDLRQGFRIFRRSPGFSLLLLLIVALAIGANSASFTVLRATLVNGLPYTNPDRIVHLWETGAGTENGTGINRSEASYPDFLDWRAQATAFEALEGYDQTNITIATPEGAVMSRGAYITPGFFNLLGIQPVLGRVFRPEENLPDGLPIAILSYATWQNRFGGSSAMLDSSLVVDGTRISVIGVLPAGFHFAPIGDAELWMPLQPGPRVGFRFNHWLRVIGRLDEGASLERAQSELSLVMTRLAGQYPETNQGRDAVVVPLRDELLGGVQPVLVALFVAMGLVLLIACANIAGLLLARALGREQEIQVRTALGATRWRLVRQLLVESLIFTTLGAVIGVILGQVGLRAVINALPDGVLDHLPALRGSSLDWTVIGYTALIATFTAIAFGLGPIIHAVASDRAVVSTSHRATGRRGLQRLRDVLLVGEIALTLVLLAGTALVGRSLASLLQVELGFRVDQVVTARIALAGPEYETDVANQRFFERVVSEVRSLPQISSVGAVSQLPLNGGGTSSLLLRGGPDLALPERPVAVTRGVAGDYFETVGIPLVSGRVFTSRDDSLAIRGMVISRALAEELVPGGEVLGRKVSFFYSPEVSWEIIGVVEDVRTGSLEAAPPLTAYLSHLQAAENRMALVIRTAVEEPQINQQVRGIVRGLDPSIPVYSTGTLRDIVNNAPAVATRRVPFTLLSIFAGSALVLAVVGLYGIVSYNVARRTRELGIRMALGAAPGQILRSVLRYGIGLALAGTAVGVAIAMGLSRFLRGLLFGIGPLDVPAYASSAALLIVVTMVATYLPARRATRVGPSIALRE